MTKKNIRVAFFIIADIIAFNASYLLAYLVVETAGAGKATIAFAAAQYADNFPAGSLILIGVKLLSLFVFSVYRILFEYADFQDYKRVVLALAAGTFASVTAAVFAGIDPALNPGVILFSFIFDVLIVFASRLSYLRVMTRSRAEAERAAEKAAGGTAGTGRAVRRRTGRAKRNIKRVMIIGSSRAAADLIEEMQQNEYAGLRPELIVDDDKNHEGGALLGIVIAGGRGDIRLLARRRAIDEIILAKPTVGRRHTAAILKECVKTRSGVKMLPLRQSRTKDAPPASLADLRRPDVSDLLGRDRPQVGHKEIGEQIRGKVVLVTGGAGVFGAELCRQIIRYKPRRLIVLDISEDDLALLASETEAAGILNGDTEFRTVIASVRDRETMRKVFFAFRPHLVFHAAELKQIPLIQMNPREAFLTNVIGLKHTADLADEFAAEKFVLISTVKAADPTGVASACKRLAEMYALDKNSQSNTRYTAVRFSNLIEGRGNVVSIFKRQIEKGGPVTVMDKDIVRYFISAEEAAILTVQAGAGAEGGETLVLGPGEPMGIWELAETMVKLSGAVPYEDIDIVVTQLRPGERLFERDEQEPEELGAEVSDRIWLAADKDRAGAGAGAKRPQRSELRYPSAEEADEMDDAAVVAFLHRVFPIYKKPGSGPTVRGVKIENE
ncbi:MAG: polysaccharide biosynthesis protein [Clostridiales Family XIII bacterium]|nr:polysaccharide biosynthesis protein [Clostridiales Family XIII bacterium]